MENCLAHIQRDSSGKIIAVQSVSEHCRNTAKHAAVALAPVGLSAAGEMAGLLHDLGKYSAQFQTYIKDGVGKRGSVNHVYAGVRLLLERNPGPLQLSGKTVLEKDSQRHLQRRRI